MSNLFGKHYKLMIFGQSHSPHIGGVIEGLPAGFTPDWTQVHAFLARRAPGNGIHSGGRSERDLPEILSGLNERGETCGAPLAFRIANRDCRSSDYDSLRDIPRPGHSDYPAHLRFAGHNDIRGGGQFSGRLTAPLCFAGALALQLLENKGIQIRSHILQIEHVNDRTANESKPDPNSISTDDYPVFDASAGIAMRKAVQRAREKGDSVGGIIECIAEHVPAGLGDPMFDGVENRLAQALWAIPGVRGLEFGSGFDAASMQGSTHNDAFRIQNGRVVTETNRHGGILSGFTTGMPILFRVAFKPTPSIAIKQRSVSLSRMENVSLTISGRHDPCIVPRAVPCVEAATAIVLYDLLSDLSLP